MLRDTLIVTFVDAIVSLICGIAVFSVLGNLAHEQVTIDHLINNMTHNVGLSVSFKAIERKRRRKILRFYLKEKDIHNEMPESRNHSFLKLCSNLNSSM